MWNVIPKESYYIIIGHPRQEIQNCFSWTPYLNWFSACLVYQNVINLLFFLSPIGHRFFSTFKCIDNTTQYMFHITRVVRTSNYKENLSLTFGNNSLNMKNSCLELSYYALTVQFSKHISISMISFVLFCLSSIIW